MAEISGGSPDDPRSQLASPPVLVEGGHYTLAVRTEPEDRGEPVVLPDGRRCTALTTPTTLHCFEAAVAQALSLRAHGLSAAISLLVGDLAVPGFRPAGAAWALPASYRDVLSASGVAPEEVRVYGEAYARNHGKRRLLDLAFARRVAPEESYRNHGWAFFRSDHNELCLASDASLDWESDVRVAMLSRASAPLCPLVFAGLKRAIFQAGFRTHWAFYAIADDHAIDRKLRAAAAIVTQLRAGRVGEQHDWLFLASLEQPSLRRRWPAEAFIAPGERRWPDFVNAVQAHHPKFMPV